MIDFYILIKDKTLLDFDITYLQHFSIIHMPKPNKSATRIKQQNELHHRRVYIISI